MNMTYAHAKPRFSPVQKAKLLEDRFISRLALNQRAMRVAKSASTLPGPKKEPKRRARRMRLNPERRTVAENRAAR